MIPLHPRPEQILNSLYPEILSNRVGNEQLRETFYWVDVLKGSSFYYGSTLFWR